VRLLAAFATGFMAFAVAALVATSSDEERCLRISLAAFLAFEFSVGVYFPSIGVLKSEIVPEAVRGTTYNIYRVPLNAIVVCLLLSHISMATCFKLCAMFLIAAFASVVAISSSTPAPPKRLDNGWDDTAKAV